MEKTLQKTFSRNFQTNFLFCSFFRVKVLLFTCPKMGGFLVQTERTLVMALYDENREQKETCSRIGLVRDYRNLQSYWTGTKLWKLTVVMD